MELSNKVILSVEKRYSVEISRLRKGVQIVLADEISLKPLPSGNYEVKSHTKGAPTAYLINPNYESCTCPDGNPIVSHDGSLLRQANLCKHMVSFLLIREQGLIQYGNQEKQTA